MVPEAQSDTPSYSRQTVEAVLQSLQTQPAGLSISDAQKRLQQYGSNTISAKDHVSAIAILLRQFKNTLTLILIGASLLILVTYIFGGREQSDLIEAGLILAIIGITVLLGFLQEYRAEKAVEALKKLIAFTATVRREGKEVVLPVENLVPGDIVLLEEGKRIPADMRLFEVSHLQTNESSLTGESVPVTKTTEPLQVEKPISDQKNMVFAGTMAVSGRGVGIVTATGNTTELGEIALTVAAVQKDLTPLQKKLADIGSKLGYLVLGISGLVFIFIVFFADDFANLPVLERVLHSFIAAVALAVAAIPEGLAAVVTISLALGTKRLLKKNALIKNLSSVETLGSTDVICSDKTGTLTKGEMTVRELYFDSTRYLLSGTGYEQKGVFTAHDQQVDPTTLTLLLQAGCECTNATLGDDESILGDPTEGALLVSAAKAGIHKKGQRVAEIPFTSERKMMSVILKHEQDYVLFTKGAPEIILNLCTTVYVQKQQVNLTEERKHQIENEIHEMSSKALRTLGFAYRVLSTDEYEKHKDQPEVFERDVTFLGLQGMIDPPRPDVKELIASCNESGIRIIMITGDHKETAKAIATEIGITGTVLTSEDLQRLNDEELLEAVRTVNVYARINPADKMKIVASLKKDKHVVAMTGDGVNDAPALKQADIGIAMGITGTDVAKEAADVVLLDDQFRTIVTAIEEGRGIYQNIKKFVHYLLTCNLAEVLIVLFGVFFLRDILLTATMLLWINIVTDGLPAIALGVDPKAKGILRISPRQFQESMIDQTVWMSISVFAVIIASLVIGLYLVNLPEGKTEARSAAFMAIVMFELIMLFLIRRTYATPSFSNKWLFIAVIATIILQLVLFAVPTLSQLFTVQHIDTHDWFLIGILSLLMWLIFSFLYRLAQVQQHR